MKFWKKLLFVGLLVLVALMVVGCDDGAEWDVDSTLDAIDEQIHVEIPDMVIEMPDLTPNEPAGTIGDMLGIEDALDATIQYATGGN